MNRSSIGAGDTAVGAAVHSVLDGHIAVTAESLTS
jgi:hypothetical protein